MLAISLALNGVVLGSVLLLFSLGLTLIYGVGRIVNFAHGALFSIGAMLGVWLAGRGLPLWLTLVVTPVAVGLIGALLDWAVLARIRDRPMVDSLLLTFGLALFITGVLYEMGGRHVQMMPIPNMLEGAISIFGFTLPVYRLFVSLLAVVLAAGLFMFLKNSDWG